MAESSFGSLQNHREPVGLAELFEPPHSCRDSVAPPSTPEHRSVEFEAISKLSREFNQVLADWRMVVALEANESVQAHGLNGPSVALLERLSELQEQLEQAQARFEAEVVRIKMPTASSAGAG